jgi:hypothetical protein
MLDYILFQYFYNCWHYWVGLLNIEGEMNDSSLSIKNYDNIDLNDVLVAITKDNSLILNHTNTSLFNPN